MKKYGCMGCMLVLATSMATGTAWAQREVRVGLSPDFPPMSMAGEWSGIFPDIFNEIFKDSDFRPAYTPIPYARGFVSVKEGSVDLSIVAQRTAVAREGFQDSVDLGKPFFLGTSVLVYNQKKHPGLSMTQLSDLQGMTLRTIIGAGTARFENAGLIVERSTNVPAMLKMVEAQRVDLFYITDVIAFHLAADLFPDRQQDLQILYENPPTVIRFMLGISKQFEGYSELRAHIDKRLPEIINDGTYRAILDKYYRGRGQPELAIPYEYYGL